jgi:hypothetical protein
MADSSGFIGTLDRFAASAEYYKMQESLAATAL